MSRQTPLYHSVLFVLLMSGPPKLRERSPSASMAGEVDWSVLLSFIIWGIAMAWVAHHLLGERILHRRYRPIGRHLYMPIVFIAAISISIFVSPAPALSAYRVAQIAVTVLFGWLWVELYGIDSAIIHVYIGCMILTVIIVLLAVVVPELVWAGNRLRGDLIANTGAISAIGLILLLSKPFLFRGKKQLLAGVLFAVPFILAQTRSAYVPFLIFLILALFVLPKTSRVRPLAWGFMMLLPAVIAFDWIRVATDWMIREESSLYTMSSRTDLWEHTVQASLATSPLLGVGIFAERFITLEFNSGLGSAHSAYIGVMAGAGLIGISVFMVAILGLIRDNYRLFSLRRPGPNDLALTGLLVTVLCIGFVSVELLVASPTAFVFWLLFSLVPESLKHKKCGANGAKRGAPMVFERASGLADE